MSDKIEELVEVIDNAGNDFIDNIFIPAVKGAKSIIAEETKMNYYLKFKTEYLEQKINLFIEYLQDRDKDEIINFVEHLKDENREFFIKTINKVFDLDNNLQIYVLAYLVKEYQKNGELNYFDKSIYYNIEQLSEDDLKIYSNLMNTIQVSENNPEAFPISEDLTEIEKIILVKFTNIGIIQTINGRFGGPFITKTTYSNKLADIINSFN